MATGGVPHLRFGDEQGALGFGGGSGGTADFLFQIHGIHLAQHHAGGNFVPLIGVDLEHPTGLRGADGISQPGVDRADAEHASLELFLLYFGHSYFGGAKGAFGV